MSIPVLPMFPYLGKVLVHACLQVVQVAQLQTAAEQAQLLQVGVSAHLHISDAALASRSTLCRREELTAHKSQP